MNRRGLNKRLAKIDKNKNPADLKDQRGFYFLETNMKMYILVKESVPLGLAMTAAAHASLAGYLKFKDTDEVTKWLSDVFYKVVCKVNEHEFLKAKRS
jgi:peptidyl-tRNA hydrolase